MSEIEVKKNQTSVLNFTAEDKETMRKSLCSTLNDGEFETFIKVCSYSSLNPFKKQIYAIKRNTKKGPVVTFQTGIDGFRAIANRTGLHEATEILYKGKGEDKQFQDYWDSEQAPSVCKALVYKKGCERPFVAQARLKSYIVSINPLWTSQPENMLAKCAEALALRKAFPEDLSGLNTSEEMGQADRPTAITATPTEIEDDMVINADFDAKYIGTSEQKKMLLEIFKELEIKDKDEMKSINNKLIAAQIDANLDEMKKYILQL